MHPPRPWCPRSGCPTTSCAMWPRACLTPTPPAWRSSRGATSSIATSKHSISRAWSGQPGPSSSAESWAVCTQWYAACSFISRRCSMSKFTCELTEYAEGFALEVLWVVSLYPQLKAKKADTYSLCNHSQIFARYGLKDPWFTMESDIFPGCSLSIWWKLEDKHCTKILPCFCHSLIKNKIT